MESKCFYCPHVGYSATSSSYVTVGGKTYPVCDACDEKIGIMAADEFAEDTPTKD